MFTKEGTKIGLPVLGICTATGSCGALEGATSELETAKCRLDESVVESLAEMTPETNLPALMQEVGIEHSKLIKQGTMSNCIELLLGFKKEKLMLGVQN